MSQDTGKTTKKTRPENSAKTCDTCRREIRTKEQKPMSVDEALELWERFAVLDLAIRGIESIADSGFCLGLDQARALKYFSYDAMRDMAEFLSRMDDNGLYFRDFRKDGLGTYDAEQPEDNKEAAA